MLSATPPSMTTALDLARQLHDRYQQIISEPLEFRGEVTVTVRESARIVDILGYAKAELGFDLLLDVCGVDNLGSDPRFDVVYHLYSCADQQYLRVRTSVGEDLPELPTVCGIWRAAEWHEREVFDMMGIRFTAHPDLRRILMWEGYPHHPLRKDFPLAGLPVDEVVRAAPMAGGPFVTTAGEKTTVEREPRAKGETNSVV